MNDHLRQQSGADKASGSDCDKTISGRSSRPQPISTAYSANPALCPVSINGEAREWWDHPGAAPADTPVFDGIDDTLIVEEIKKRLRNGELPMIEIPDHIMRTLKLLDDPDFSFTDVAELVQRSPAMAGEFLKVINSSFYGSGKVIRDLKTALPRLGKVKVKSLLYIYSASMNFVGCKMFNNVVVDIVEHCYAVGVIASYLSQRFFPDPDAAFLAGLLHDIGKLAIIKTITDTHDIPLKLDVPIDEDLFVHIFPDLHEKTGLYIADHWMLDKYVRVVIRHHHDVKVPRRSCDDYELAVSLCHLINVSDTIARILGKGRSWVDPVNIFELPSARALHLDRNWSNIEFLNEIPSIIDFKLER